MVTILPCHTRPCQGGEVKVRAEAYQFTAAPVYPLSPVKFELDLKGPDPKGPNRKWPGDFPQATPSRAENVSP